MAKVSSRTGGALIMRFSKANGSLYTEEQADKPVEHPLRVGGGRTWECRTNRITRSLSRPIANPAPACTVTFTSGAWKVKNFRDRYEYVRRNRCVVTIPSVLASVSMRS